MIRRRLHYADVCGYVPPALTLFGNQSASLLVAPFGNIQNIQYNIVQPIWYFVFRIFTVNGAKPGSVLGYTVDQLMSL